MKIEIFRIKCRGCDKIFCASTLKQAKEKHKVHIKKCPTIIGLKKAARFQKKAEKILGRKLSFREVLYILGHSV